MKDGSRFFGLLCFRNFPVEMKYQRPIIILNQYKEVRHFPINLNCPVMWHASFYAWRLVTSFDAVYFAIYSNLPQVPSVTWEVPAQIVRHIDNRYHLAFVLFNLVFQKTSVILYLFLNLFQIVGVNWSPSFEGPLATEEVYFLILKSRKDFCYCYWYFLSHCNALLTTV